MPRFPSLKTGAVVQYPARRQIRYRTDVVEFVDGTVQTYRDYPGPLRRWVIQLDALDPLEIRDFDQFFHEVQGAYGRFSFPDPSDQIVYENCSFDTDSVEFEMTDELRGRGVVIVRQNRD